MSKKIKSYLIFIGVVVVACVIGLINAFVITGGIKMDALVQSAKQEKVLVKNVLLTETKDGGKYWEIFADDGEYLNKKNKIFLRKVIGNFYKKNEVVFSFEGDEGFYESKLKKVTLIKNARIVAKNNTSLRADRIIWEGTEDKIIAEGNVDVIKSDDIVTKSDKTVFTTDFKEFNIYGNATTKIFNKGKN